MGVFLLSDEAIPRGLHVRMNLATGLKEAKLLDEMGDSNDNNLEYEDTEGAVNYYRNIKEKTKFIQSEDGKTPKVCIEFFIFIECVKYKCYFPGVVFV